MLEEKYYKVGRIYWIKPTAIPGMESKIRPGIVLEKYDKAKTTFLHLGTTEFKEPASVKATMVFRENIKKDSFNEKYQNSWIHLDASKPEWNTGIIKPHFKNDNYVDVPNKAMKKLRAIYHNRTKKLEIIRYKKARIHLINNKQDDAKKQLILLKNKDPIKHKKLDIDQTMKKMKKILSKM